MFGGKCRVFVCLKVARYSNLIQFLLFSRKREEEKKRRREEEEEKKKKRERERERERRRAPRDVNVSC